jgi:hypothetical protein
VQTIVSVEPELDDRGNNAIAAPEGRKWHLGARVSLFGCGDGGVELLTVA